MTQLRLSPSAILAFKACPTRFRNRYVYGLVPVETREQLRVGLRWHSLQEIYRAALVDPETGVADHDALHVVRSSAGLDAPVEQLIPRRKEERVEREIVVNVVREAARHRCGDRISEHLDLSRVQIQPRVLHGPLRLDAGDTRYVLGLGGGGQ